MTGTLLSDLPRRFATAAVAITLTSCNTGPPLVPEFDGSRAKDAVAVVYLFGGYYLHDPECDDPGVICLDEPFQLRGEVLQQIYGERLPRLVSFTASNHSGMQWMLRRRTQLVHFVSDGTTLIVPRYHTEWIGEDAHGDFAVPADPWGLWWLPCGASDLHEKIVFRAPADGFAEPRSEFDAEELAEHPEYYSLSKYWVRPVRGTRLKKIETFLRTTMPAGDAFVCDRDDSR